MNPILSVANWLTVPSEIRERLRNIFGIGRSSHTIVNEGKIESDGTTYQDLQALTIEKMQRYLSSDSTDFIKLFNEIVDLINNQIQKEKNPSPPIPVKMDIHQGYTPEQLASTTKLEAAPLSPKGKAKTAKKPGRPKKI